MDTSNIACRPTGFYSLVLGQADTVRFIVMKCLSMCFLIVEVKTSDGDIESCEGGTIRVDYFLRTEEYLTPSYSLRSRAVRRADSLPFIETWLSNNSNIITNPRKITRGEIALCSPIQLSLLSRFSSTTVVSSSCARAVVWQGDSNKVFLLIFTVWVQILNWIIIRQQNVAASFSYLRVLCKWL